MTTVTVTINGKEVELELADARQLITDLKQQITLATEFTPKVVVPPRVDPETGCLRRDDVFKFFDQFYAAKVRDRRAGHVFAALTQLYMADMFCTDCWRAYTDPCGMPRRRTHRRTLMMVDAVSLIDCQDKMLGKIEHRKPQLRRDMVLLFTHLTRKT